MRHVIHSLVFAVVLVLPAVSADASESGPLAVYADQFQGRPTASGVPYEAGKLTAAHASMPFGTMVRVANFETGRMVDVVINDRKGADGRILTLSRAAAEAVQLPLNRTAPGSLLVIQPSAAPSVAGSPAAPSAPGRIPAPVAPASQGQALSHGGQAVAPGQPEARKFRPFGGLFAKEAVPTAPSTAAPVQYGIPAAQYDSHFTRTAPVYPAPAQPGSQVLTHMNAGSPVAPLPAARQAPVNKGQANSGVPMASLASASMPYRVQFGAFRRAAKTNELAAMPGGAVVDSKVFASPGTGVEPRRDAGWFCVGRCRSALDRFRGSPPGLERASRCDSLIQRVHPIEGGSVHPACQRRACGANMAKCGTFLQASSRHLFS